MNFLLEEKKPGTLVTFLLANKYNDNNGITIITGENEERFISYKSLFTRASSVLYELQSRGLRRGSELVLQLDDNEHFIYVFWACVLGGIIPVSLTVGTTDELKWKLFHILSILNNPYIVTDKKTWSTMDKQLSDNGFNISNKTYIIEDLLINISNAGRIEDIEEKDIAFIQFSSGSTGEPKGVVLTHENLLTNINAMISGSRITTADSTFSWMPLTHDMGLIGFHLVPLVRMIDQYIMPTQLFVRRPSLWIKKAHEHRASLLCSPNFGYRYFLDNLKRSKDTNWELSHIRLIYNGAEPICSELCDEFLDRMEVYGLKRNVMFSVYGMAEASLAISFPAPGEEYRSVVLDRHSLALGGNVSETESTRDGVRFVEVGCAVNDCSIRICDENDKTLEDNRIGHIQIKGKNVTSGYYNNPDATEKAFTDDGWLDTGDLGFLRNGTLVITGRAKDIVFVNGQNYYPHDIERVAQEVEGIELGKVAACGVFNERLQKEEIILFVLHRGAAKEFVPLAIELKQYIGSKTGVQIAAVVPVKKIPKTTSGKIQRYKLGESYRSGEFSKQMDEVDALIALMPKLHRVEPESSTEEKLVSIWAKLLNTKEEDISVEEHFFLLGGDSLKVTLLASEISDEFGADIPLSEMINLLTIRKLAVYLDRIDKQVYPQIEPLAGEESYPMSSAQKRMYFLNRMEEQGTSYNMTFGVTIEGPVDKDRLEDTLRKLIKRHESFRTSFHVINGEAVQKIHEAAEFRIETADTNERDLKHLVDSFVCPFDLSKTPLMRVLLAKLGEQKYLLLLDMHHIIADGTSMGIFIHDFNRLYQDAGLAEPRIQYKDFAVWQNRLFKEAFLKKQETYWLEALSGELPVLELPYDYQRPSVQSFEGGVAYFAVEKEAAEKLKKYAFKNNMTLYMVLLAAYYIVLYKYSEQEDIIIGTPIAGRRRSELKNVIGMFVNTLALRNYPVGSKSLRTFLAEIRENALAAYDNQDMQFEELVERLNIKRDPGRNPLFDTMFILQNMDISGFEINGLKFLHYDIKSSSSKFDLTLEATETSDGIGFKLEYCTKLFKSETISKLAEHYVNVLMQLEGNEDAKLCDISILSDKEKRQVITGFNDTEASYPKDKTINQLFEEQVIKTPGRTAISYGSVQLTYKELDERANRVADYLIQRHGIIPDMPVGLVMKRSEHLLAAILGILKAGGAYVPMDPSYPEARMKTIIEDAGIRVVLCDSETKRIMDRLQWECNGFYSYLCIDEEGKEPFNGSIEEKLHDEEKLWDFIGSNAEEEIGESGWANSYNGEAFSTEEMEEYAANTLKKLKPYLNENVRILEVGCGSGLVMKKLAPYAGFYLGTDISNSVIEKNKQRIAAEKVTNVRFEHMSAHEIDRLRGQTFDIILLNSVIQYFPSHDYLKAVMDKAINLLGTQGIIFIGDIRDLELKQQYMDSLTAYVKNNSDGSCKVKTGFHDELFISRAFLEDLAAEKSVISEAAFSTKIHTIENELTKYRFDAILMIDKIGSKIGKQEKHRYQHNAAELEKYSAAAPVAAVKPDNMAYIIYTSGSTGKPKGVMIEHTSVVNLVWSMQKKYPLEQEDAYLLKTSYTFDVSAAELFGWFLDGGRLVVLPQGEEVDPQAILSIIERKGITHINFVPSMFNFFVNALEGKAVRQFNRLKYVFLAGEAVAIEPVNRFYRQVKGVRLENLYGPTEGTIYATGYSLSDQVYKGNVPIGKPLPNVCIYIVDSSGRPLPVGIPGELCIAGVGLARGYLNNEPLTKEKFVNNPYINGERMYKTGDKAGWLPDGNIAFMGRIDSQLKIRGFRIEPGEIEKCLCTHEGIKEAVVAAFDDKDGGGCLCAYVVPASHVSVAEVRAYLAEKLPDYMIPAYYIALDELPVLASGKIDRKALPGIDAALNGGSKYLSPRNSIEEQLASIWKKILGRDRIGVDDNFFDIGGNSLLLIQVHNEIEKLFAGMVKVADLFAYPTIAKISGFIAGKADPDYADDRKDAVAEHKKSRDIAIIGIAAKLPQANDIDRFWSNLKAGKDAVREVPEARRRDCEAYLSYVRARRGLAMESKGYQLGGYLDEIDKFDYGFFKMTPKEASLMDPNQRLFLETIWGAMEDAGYGGNKLKGSRTGIFLGFGDSKINNYERLISEVEPEALSAAMVGNVTSVISSRMAYIMDFRGPSLTVDTACSSSLVAVHLACRTIRDGDCEQAFAGGVKLYVLPMDNGVRIGIESAGGKAKTFDDDADGTGGGEGAAAVFLKPLDQAVKDGDHIYAVIKGSALNQDGSSIGITAPNVLAQEDVIVSAWKDAGVDPRTISYIEAHGTGTPLGDPIEVEGITRAFRRYTEEKQFCAIGSVKTNIGHLGDAAGVTGLVKAALALKYKALPPSIHFEKPNREIDFANSPVYVNTRLRKWETDRCPRRCGVSAFGLSGTNCHVVLEEAPECKTEKSTDQYEAHLQLLTISAKTKQALRALVNAYIGCMIGYKNLNLRNMCFTANTGRGHYHYRLGVLFENKGELLQKLEKIYHSDLESMCFERVYYGMCENTSKAGVTATDCSGAGSKRLENIAQLYVQGMDIKWEEVYRGEVGLERVRLPIYLFDRSRCWIDIPKATAAVQARHENKASDSQQTAIPIAKLKGRESNRYTKTERTLAGIWKKVLGFDEFDIEDHFFKLGGDSIAAVMVVNEIYKQLGVRLKLVDISVYPTIHELAAYISIGRALSEDVEEEAAVAIEESKMTELPVTLLNDVADKILFAFPPGLGFGIVFNHMAHLLEGYALYAFDYIEDDERENKYIEIITSIQDKGPYRLLGFSAGGILAFDVAKELTRRGYDISGIILLDTLLEMEKLTEGTKASYKPAFVNLRKPRNLSLLINMYLQIGKEIIKSQQVEVNGKKKENGWIGGKGIFLRYFIKDILSIKNKFIRQAVKGKIRSYFRYLNNCVLSASEKVKTDIYLIKSPTTREGHTEFWGELTEGEFRKYDGKGNHLELISPGCVKYNAEITQSILKKMD